MHVQIAFDTNNPEDKASLQRLFASAQPCASESSTAAAASTTPSSSTEPSEDSSKDSKPAKKTRKPRKSKSTAKDADAASAPGDTAAAASTSSGDTAAPSQEDARKAMLACAKATNDKDFTLGLIEKYAGEGKRALKHVPDDKLADLIQEFELAVAENS